ncbi:hypothetical protein TELCIR_10908 [Teladorsagia circumcincta]|uniref:C2H2-type domain-containing protein n=1 Tax=Teladorsagia circumcincta TaxID=45464 RepID=A0A2G9UAS5_TELCI|nr:hypothetical protein TELCIR_10908 [Teladorsagia circumcincta]
MQLDREANLGKKDEPMPSNNRVDRKRFFNLVASLYDAHSRHQGQMYQCDICQMQFSQKMQEHSMTHIKTGIYFDCPCAVSVPSKANGFFSKKPGFLKNCVSATRTAQRRNKKLCSEKRDSSELSPSPDLEQHASYPIASEDVLIMYINSSLKQPAASAMVRHHYEKLQMCLGSNRSHFQSRSITERSDSLMAADANIQCDIQTHEATIQANGEVNDEEPMISHKAEEVEFFDKLTNFPRDMLILACAGPLPSIVDNLCVNRGLWQRDSVLRSTL